MISHVFKGKLPRCAHLSCFHSRVCGQQVAVAGWSNVAMAGMTQLSSTYFHMPHSQGMVSWGWQLSTREPTTEEDKLVAAIHETASHVRGQAGIHTCFSSIACVIFADIFHGPHQVVRPSPTEGGTTKSGQRVWMQGGLSLGPLVESIDCTDPDLKLEAESVSL